MTEDPRVEPGLFDLPLDAPPPVGPERLAEVADEHAAPDASPSRRRALRSSTRPESLPLFDFETEPESARARPEARSAVAEGARPRSSAQRAGPTALPDPPRSERAAALAPRLWGTGGDLVVVAATAAVAALGASWLGAPIGVAQIVPLMLFLLSWSFVYFVVPLAFWGATPGMSWAGLVAKTSATEPLSFGQAAMRWFGTWLTWATLGIGGLLALTGRSLADRLSGSSTYPNASANASANASTSGLSARA